MNGEVNAAVLTLADVPEGATLAGVEVLVRAEHIECDSLDVVVDWHVYTFGAGSVS